MIRFVRVYLQILSVITPHELFEKTGARVMDYSVVKDPKFAVRGQNGACVACGNQQGQV